MQRVTPLVPTNLAIASDPGDAGFGALKTAAGLLPLKAVEIETRIHGLAAETSLRQTFVNACPDTLEAVYIFPLPPSAAVTHFTMTAQRPPGRGDTHGTLRGPRGLQRGAP